MMINMSLRSRALVSAAAVALFSVVGVSAHAATDAKLDTLLNGGTLVFGDKVFSGFVFSAENVFDPLTNAALTVAEAASLIDVKAGLIGSNIGLDFMTPFHAHGGTSSALHIDFTVSITDPALYFSDVHVDGTPSVTGSGQATGVTTVNDLSHTLVPMTPPGLLKIYDYGVGGPATVLNASSDLLKPFSLKVLMTESDLQFSAVPGSNTEFAHYQVSFSQAVPEPSTYAMALVGLVGMGLIARRRRHQG